MQKRSNDANENTKNGSSENNGNKRCLPGSKNQKRVPKDN